jgi:rhodanese-related sulfurtransferase
LRPLDQLRNSLRDLPADRAIAVHCKGGYRSAIACSLLQAAGYQQAINVQGGFDAWVRAGLDVER